MRTGLSAFPCGQNIRVRERVYDGCSSCQRTQWLGCWPTSPGWSIRNSCSRMNTSQPRIASSEPNFPPVCVFRIPNDQPLLRSVSDSAVLRFSRLPVWPSPIPSSPGTGGSLPANSTAPSCVLHPAGPASHPTSKRSLSASPGRTPVGDTTVSSEPWPISATRCPIRRWQHPSTIRNPAGTQAEPEYHLEGFHLLPHGRPGWYRLLHSRNAHLARSRHLLRLVLHSSGISPRQSRRFDRHPTAEWMLQIARNATDEGSGFLCGMRYLLHDRDNKILHCVSRCPAVKRNTDIGPPTQESESELFLRALGVFPPARMPVQTHSVRRNVVTPGVERIHRTSSF